MPEPKPLPPLDLARSTFDYDHATGVLRRRSDGGIATNLHERGPPRVRVGGSSHPAARIAWLLMTGHDPDPEFGVRPRNGIDADLSWANLELARRPRTRDDVARRLRELPRRRTKKDHAR